MHRKKRGAGVEMISTSSRRGKEAGVEYIREAVSDEAEMDQGAIITEDLDRDLF